MTGIQWPMFCDQCQTAPQLVPAYGAWIWRCNCPPPLTWASNNTGETEPPPELTRKPTRG